MRENITAENAIISNENAPSATSLLLIVFLSLRWLLIHVIFFSVALSKLLSVIDQGAQA